MLDGKNFLAIIPARAGSKGIPNKNLRIIGNHPLAYYSIQNAVCSDYIDKVVVTTDSYDINILSRQLGVDVVEREAKLCDDSTVLDDVILDVYRRYGEWDYVVTLQPTSPTLKGSTLDCAIKHCCKNGYDSLISVVNKPHLAWINDVQGVKPAYKERLNRQYLPPYYMETGAFVISQSKILQSGRRIGGKVGVFEIDEDEAIDIDTFEDLIVAEEIINRQRVAIYVNGNNSRGMGHICRALEIADEFSSKPDIYYDIHQTDEKLFGDTKHNLIPVNGIVELFEQCKKVQYTLFINDILSTSIDYMIGLKTILPKAKIINIEDDGEGAFEADAVINALFERGKIVNAYCGEEFFIPRKLFMYYTPIVVNETVKTMFVCFGGGDPQNYTDRILNIIIKKEYEMFNFIVAVGKAKKNVEELLKFNDYPNIEVYFDVDNMPELMSRADFAVASRGRTCYELAMLGVPTISISENERELKHTFISPENGFTALGTDPSNEIIEEQIKMYFSMSKQMREHCQRLLLEHDLRRGRENFKMIIGSLKK